MSEKAEILKTSALIKVFGHGNAQVRAVDGVDLSVRAGELLLIMGPSGSGKTTLLTMIGGLLHPTSGSVVIGGVDLGLLDERALTALRRRTVGFIFQSFNLWEALSVRENVELALNIAGVNGGRARSRATGLLEQLGLRQRLGFRTRDLSGGEKQRVSIARALANEPRLVLADEPTANLDSAHGREVMQLLKEISRSAERAVVVVSHDQRIREVADRVLWLEDGRIKEIGGLTRDPVCGMSVEQGVATVDFRGQTYHFCSRGCSLEFLASPSKFVAEERAPV